MKRRRNRKGKRGVRAIRRDSDSSATQAGELTVRRKWLFRLAAVFMLPLLVVGGLEVLLRLCGVGFAPDFFVQEQIGGKSCYVANEDFGLRFFPRGLARIPAPVVVPAEKGTNNFRIFIFGESAALGDPRPNYGAGCYLEVLLAERFPAATFEVINTSMTAINSHVILPIARESARHGGDLWIIYMGNNEMVGPFGAATVFGTRAPPLWLARAQLQLRRFRLVQVLTEWGQKLQSGSAKHAWQGMEMFVENRVAPDHPSRQRVYRNFKRNLQDILKSGLDCDARIVLSTVAVNLKDCPPFGSVAETNLPAVARAEFERFRQQGMTAEEQGQFAEARMAFDRAIQIQPQAAETRFQLARSLLLLSNAPAAQPHFLQAVDDDTLPFRADSSVNQTIRAAASQFARESVALCDATNALGAASPDGIPGAELFYEHVHLNPDGNYALALAWAAEVEKMLIPELKRGARSHWISQAECERWLGLTDWNRVSILEEVLGRVQQAPFSGQLGHGQRVEGLRSEIDRLRQRLTDDAQRKAREVYEQALRRAPENHRLHENYAEFLEAIRDLPAAIEVRRKVRELIPHHYFSHYALGVDLKEAGSLAEAREVLLKAVSMQPEQGETRLELGVVYARQQEWELARQQLEAARRLSPGDPRALLYLGEVLWKLGRRAEAMGALRDAIRLAPSDWQPRYRLASNLAQQGDFSQAAIEYQEAVRLDPGNVRSRLGLAVALLNLRRESEAMEQLDEILQSDPANETALELQRKVRGW